MKKNESTVLRPKTVCTELDISIATFWRLVKAEKIKTVKLSSRCTGVLQDDFATYLRNIKGI